MGKIHFVLKVLFEIHNKYFEKEVDEKTYKETIFNSDYNCYEFASLLRSEYYFFKNDYSNAKIEIEKIISPHTEEPFQYHNFTIMGNGEMTCSNGIKEEVFVPFDSFDEKVYDCAAQIYAELNDGDKSLQCYKKSRYYSTILKSDFDGIKSESGYVYSFRPVSNYALSDIATNSITLCNPKVVNDPFDSLFQHWATNENFDKTCKRKEHIKSLVDSYQYYKIRSFVGNKELTKDDSIIRKVTMWSHYADSHKGFCIRYKFSKYIIDKYDDELYKHHFLKRINYNNICNKINLHVKEMDTDKLLATKSYEWEYENEIRLISYDPDCKDNFLQIKLDSGSRVDAIYFGYRCSDSDIALIKRILGEQVKYYKMKIDKSNVYRLKIKQI